jgi:hypothetical protein
MMEQITLMAGYGAIASILLLIGVIGICGALIVVAQTVKELTR